MGDPECLLDPVRVGLLVYESGDECRVSSKGSTFAPVPVLCAWILMRGRELNDVVHESPRIQSSMPCNKSANPYEAATIARMISGPPSAVMTCRP